MLTASVGLKELEGRSAVLIKGSDPSLLENAVSADILLRQGYGGQAAGSTIS